MKSLVGLCVLVFGSISLVHSQDVFVDSGQIFPRVHSADVKAVDLNADGYLDVFVGAINGPSRFYLNDGLGNMAILDDTIGGTQDAAFGDVDGDGDIDIVTTAGFPSMIRTWLSDGNYSPLPTYTAISSGPFYYSEFVRRYSLTLDLGDLDQDGILDIVIGTYQNNTYTGGPVAVFFGIGDGRFSYGGQHFFNSYNFVKLGDADNDGDLDIFVANGPGDYSGLLLNGANGDPLGTFSQGQDFGYYHGQNLDLADLDNDGDLDVVITNHGERHPGYVQCWMNATDGDPLGVFRLGQEIRIGANVPDVTINDFDLDGDQDLFIANYIDGVQLWMNGEYQDPLGTFSFRQGYSAPGLASRAVDSGDYNGDGLVDVFVGSLGLGFTDQLLFNILEPPCSFGPEEQPLVYVRESSRPDDFHLEWESCGGPGTLVIDTVNISSAIVTLNGAVVAGTSDFSAGQLHLEIDIELFELNLLDIELRSKPGGTMTVAFEE